MSYTLLIAVFGTGVASLPLFVSGRRSLLNPALLVFGIVTCSLLLESLYIALFRPRPAVGGIDLLYVRATTSHYFFSGAVLVLVAVCGYVAGFFCVGRRTVPLQLPPSTRRQPSPRMSRYVVGVLLVLAVACFVGYLLASDTNLLAGPFSEKRFRPREIGVVSRFLYLPYYLFKLALASGSLAYSVGLLLMCAETRRGERVDKLLFSWVFLFALMLSHYASLRLFILVLLLQIYLLALYLKDRRHALFLAAFGLLTISSFGWITLIDRAMPARRLPPAVEATAVEAKPESETGRVREAEPTSRNSVRHWLDWENTVLITKLQRPLASVFDGRYFLDIAKMAQIAHHFPEKAPFLRGKGLLGRAPTAAPDAAPSDGTFNRYLSRTVFEDPNNAIPPGFGGELYINFGWAGIAIGFLALGALHRLVFNHLSQPDLPILAAGFLVVLIPSTTIVLINSGILAAVSRSVLDFTVLIVVWLPFGRLRRTGGRDTEDGTGVNRP